VHQVSNECVTHQGKECLVSECDASGPTDGSCADECCKHHDNCCGSSDRSSCNSGIIACLHACNQNGTGTCWRDGSILDVPVPVDAVLAGMEMDPYGCCGTSCDMSTDKPMNISTHMSELNATATGPAWTRGGVEAPTGTKDMGGWVAHVYTKEQMARLGVDEDGKLSGL